MMELVLASDASGAAMAGERGLVVMVVDVIDFSTTMEAALDAGALAVFGAGPDQASPPVAIDPFGIGRLAGLLAVEKETDIIMVAEPRVGPDQLRAASVSRVMQGIESARGKIMAILPNMGAETASMACMKGKVLVGATHTGGVAFDAAITAGAAAVVTGTIARTLKKNGFAAARDSAVRLIEAARERGRGMAVVSASGNSPEDLLAAEYLYKIVLSMIR